MIVVIDYGMGNIGSILNILRKADGRAVASADPAVIAQAEKLILPGVGAFDNAVTRLRQLGIVDLLTQKATVEKVPVLGICLGMQLLGHASEEGVEKGLGWIDAETRRFQFDAPETRRKIPHMGWNILRPRSATGAFADLDSEETRFYFVHSFHVVCHDPADVLATSHYGFEFTAAAGRGNIVGVQFHPEKSHRFGLQLMRNFVRL